MIARATSTRCAIMPNSGREPVAEVAGAVLRALAAVVAGRHTV